MQLANKEVKKVKKLTMTQIHVLKKMCQMKKYENIMSEIKIYLLDIVIEVERECRQMYVFSSIGERIYPMGILCQK